MKKEEKKRARNKYGRQERDVTTHNVDSSGINTTDFQGLHPCVTSTKQRVLQ
jgi:hypothetical protein